MKLVPNWKEWWKMWSIRLNIIFGAILVVLSQFPETFIHLWLLLPQEMKDQAMTIDGLVTMFIVMLAVSSVARLIQQSKLNKDKEKEGE